MSDALTKVYPGGDLAALLQQYDDYLEASSGEVTPEIEAIEREIAKLSKVEQLSNAYLYLEAEERGLEAKYEPIIGEMEADIKAIVRRKDRVKQLIMRVLPPGPESEMSSSGTNIFYSESSAVDVIDVEALPIEYVNYPPVPDKKLIGQALKNGKEVPGAQLKVNWNLQIKHAGPRAVTNARKRQKDRAEKTVALEGSLMDEAKKVF